MEIEHEQARAAAAVSEALSRPRSLAPECKCKADTSLPLPKFCQGYGWASPDKPPLSPAALFSEHAPPLTLPPAHILANQHYQDTVDECFRKGLIKVDTPFNLDWLETYLADHPNKPYVRSVLDGCHNGFWPLDDGDWEDSKQPILSNYVSEQIDIDAICAFWDKEIAAG